MLVHGVFGGHQTDNQNPVDYIAGAATAYASTFRVAVYQFAVTGETVGRFDPRLLQAAFVAR